MKDQTNTRHSPFQDMTGDQVELTGEPVEWLWENRIPFKSISMLFGQPGIGKSQLSCILAADVSRGRIGGKPRNVLMSLAEDPLPMARARLEAAEADLTRIRFPKDGVPLQFPDDIEMLEEYIQANDISMVVIDPLAAHLSAKVSMNNDQSIRRAMTPLKVMAERNNVAVTLISHPIKNRSRSVNPLELLGGSFGGVVGSVRTALFFARDPHYPKDQRILAVAKNNYGRDDIPSLVYEVEQVMVETQNKRKVQVPRLQYLYDSPMGAHELVATPANNWRPSKVEEAKQYLELVLRHEPVLAVDVEERAFRHGIAKKTLRRAREEMMDAGKLEVFKRERRSYWRLP